MRPSAIYGSSYLDMIERISHLVAAFPQVRAGLCGLWPSTVKITDPPLLDLNPVRVFEQRHGAFVLDAHIRVDKKVFKICQNIT